MADYTGVGRTNYVRYKDIEKVRALCMDVPELELVPQKQTAGEEDADNERYAILFLTNHGHPPTLWADDDYAAPYLPEGRDEADFLADILAPMLEDGEVLISVHSGSEKHRYVGGSAFAFDNTGKMASVSLMDIMVRVADEWPGVTVTDPEY